MSRQNPLQPKSSLLEKNSRNRSGLQMVLIIMAAHVIFLGGLLFSGCRQENSIPPLVGKTNSIPNLPPIVDVAVPQSNNVNIVDSPPIAELTNSLDSGPPLPVPSVKTTQSPNGSDQFVSEVVPLVPVPTLDSTEVPIKSDQSEYIVLKGDNYTTIARKHSVTIAALKAANPAVDPNRIAIGQVLVIPAPLLQKAEPDLLEGVITYEVKAGDNLYTIAKNHKTTVKVIRDENNLKTSNIRPGQKLIIPKTISE
ncbi:MAG: LysM peptidoglycan-binding domain-containing protein [Limisphaerales bacterium]